MSKREAFERLLASLHDAALDDALWPATSRLLDEACAARGNSLIVGEGSRNVKIHFAQFYQHGQRRPDLEGEYFRIYYPRDERMPRLRKLPDGRLTLVKDLYTHEELKSSPAYNEWVRRLGSQNGLNVRLDGPDGTRIVWSLGSCTAPGDWGSDQVDVIQRLLPHIRQFVRVRQALAGANALGASLVELIEHSGIGVIQLDRRGRIVEANGPAYDLLRRGDGLSDQNGFLGAWLPADNARLQHLLALSLAPFGGQGQAGGGSTTIRRSPGLPKLVLHVNPVHDRGLGFSALPVAALVLIVEPGSQPRLDAELVAEALDLSTAESQVAVMLAAGMTIGDVAAATNRQPGTVRVLIRRAYRKLGISRQVDLARLVLSLQAVSPRR